MLGGESAAPAAPAPLVGPDGAKVTPSEVHRATAAGLKAQLAEAQYQLRIAQQADRASPHSLRRGRGGGREILFSRDEQAKIRARHETLRGQVVALEAQIAAAEAKADTAEKAEWFEMQRAAYAREEAARNTREGQERIAERDEQRRYQESREAEQRAYNEGREAERVARADADKRAARQAKDAATAQRRQGEDAKASSTRRLAQNKSATDFADDAIKAHGIEWRAEDDGSKRPFGGPGLGYSREQLRGPANEAWEAWLARWGDDSLPAERDAAKAEIYRRLRIPDEAGVSAQTPSMAPSTPDVPQAAAQQPTREQEAAAIRALPQGSPERAAALRAYVEKYGSPQ